MEVLHPVGSPPSGREHTVKPRVGKDLLLISLTASATGGSRVVDEHVTLQLNLGIVVMVAK